MYTYKNRTYDYIIPLGDHCAVALALKELGLRKYAYPFDWVSHVKPDDSNCLLMGQILEIIREKELGDFLSIGWSDITHPFITRGGLYFAHERSETERSDVEGSEPEHSEAKCSETERSDVERSESVECNEIEPNKRWKELSECDYYSKLLWRRTLEYKYERRLNRMLTHLNNGRCLLLICTRFSKLDIFLPEFKQEIDEEFGKKHQIVVISGVKCNPIAGVDYIHIDYPMISYPDWDYTNFRPEIKRVLSEIKITEGGTKQIPSLTDVMYKYNSDKSPLKGWHNYTEYYEKLFRTEFCTGTPLESIHNFALLEIGIGSTDETIPSNMGKNGTAGASLRGWKEWFTELFMCHPSYNVVSIFGADIDPKTMFSEKGIKTFLCNQSVPYSFSFLKKLPELDVIIDDGLHSFSANFNTLLTCIHKLKKNGLYIIEDLKQETAELFEKCKNDLKNTLNVKSIEIVEIPYENNTLDNRLLVIKK